MFDTLIRFSLQHRTFVIACAALAIAWGGWVLPRLPVDVFPDLNRPTVTILTESGGLSPEEVERLVSSQLEYVVNGLPGVQRVRSSSTVGLSIVWVEFDWGTDVYRNRQLVAEKLAAVRDRLPTGIEPTLAPVSSIMGEILLLGLTGDSVGPLELRTIADWTIRPRLLSIPGIAQVTTMGGGVTQLQVFVDPKKLAALGVTLDEVERAAGLAQGNTPGGFVEHKGRELLVRNLARTSDVRDFAGEIVAIREGTPIRLDAVAEVRVGPAVTRGSGGVDGKPAVVLAVQKQPGASTIDLDQGIAAAVRELEGQLPPGVRMTTLFRQSRFIQHAVGNVVDALRDGAILVAIVLALFLVNLRTTFITLTAIPLSFLLTAIVFYAFGLGIDTMTLGGLAVAVGELVDDAIVDVENVFRRLKENRARPDPAPVLRVVFDASREVRSSIVYATAVVVLVFVPLFSLGGVEGRLFVPLGIAYIVSILASLIVSLTVTPVLCAWLLPRARVIEERKDGALVRWLKRNDRALLERVVDRPVPVMLFGGALVATALVALPFMGRAFLPPFNEGTATVSVQSRPGTSLEESVRLATIAERLILDVPEVASTGRRTGRAEQDEHAEGVHSSEIDVDFDEEGRPRDVVLGEIRAKLSQLPGVVVSVGQPISHRLDHLLSGVRAQIAVKIFGPNLDELRTAAQQVRDVMAEVEGVVDLQVEQQVLVPQLRIQVEREKARRWGFRAGELAQRLETVIGGRVVGEIVEDARTIEVLVRVEDAARASADALAHVLIESPTGAHVPLGELASVFETTGPNAIHHENGQRRTVVLANVAGRDVGRVVEEIQQRVGERVRLPAGAFLRYEGQFESQAAATRRIGWLSLLSLVGIFGVLWAHFRSTALVLQVLLNIPLALVGAVAGTLLAGGTLSVGSLIGFVTLCGIASRNTIMMISHYIHLVREEGMTFGRDLVIRGSLERLVPVLMTALTAVLALVPLALSGDEPGRELLHPVAVTILGGLVSSTLLDMFVTPAVFLRFGRKALERHLAEERRIEAEERELEGAPVG